MTEYNRKVLTAAFQVSISMRGIRLFDYITWHDHMPPSQNHGFSLVLLVCAKVLPNGEYHLLFALFKLSNSRSTSNGTNPSFSFFFYYYCRTTYKDIQYTTLLTLLTLLPTQYYITFSFPFAHTVREKKRKGKKLLTTFVLKVL